MNNFFKKNTVDIDQKKSEINTIIQEFTTVLGDKFLETINRNILFLGRTRVGKSSIIQILKNPSAISMPLSIYRGTVNAELSNYVFDYDAEKTKININIFDTPGLFEKSIDGVKRTTEKLLEVIKECVEKEITKFHLICFVISVKDGINDQDIEAIKIFKNYLMENMNKNCCLIVTGFENKNQTDIEKLKIEIDSLKEFDDIRDLFGRGIYFSGIIDHTYYDNGQAETFNNCLENVYNYRRILLKLIYDTKTILDVREFNFSDIKNLKLEKENFINKISTLTVTKSEYENKIEELQELNKALSVNLEKFVF